MLKIIMGSERVHEFTDRKLILYPNSYFNSVKKRFWFEDPLVQEIIRVIDKARVVTGYAVESLAYDAGYSVNDIAGGSKTLILSHMIRDESKIFLALMGDNCTDFMERIAASYEEEGKDLLITANYLHRYNFKYIDSIHYVNWDITCHSYADIDKLIRDKWYEQERADVAEEDDDIGLTKEEQEAYIQRLLASAERNEELERQQKQSE